MITGLMQEHPLLISSLLRHVELDHPDVEIVSQSVEGPLVRLRYREWAARARRLASALERLGVEPSMVVGTLAWNTHRHLELFFAVPGIGAICHTINPRLFEADLRNIVNHAADTVLFFDLTFLDLVERLAPDLKTVRAYVVMTDRQHMPQKSAVPLQCYEELLAAGTESFDWPRLDENSGCSLCYTSGTSGPPKGVLYSHRSTILHTYAMCMPDNHGLSVRDCTMPVAPMFHANAWAVPYGACAVGAKLVLPGRVIDGATIHRLIASEGVTHSVGVPTVWRMYLDHIKAEGLTAGSLQRVLIGGTALSREVLEAFAGLGVSVRHAWGMTEMSPLGTTCVLRPELDHLDVTSREEVLCKQGVAVYGVELRIVDDQARELPRDGRSMGHLQARGPWIASRYFQNDDCSAFTADGWFDTGDIAAIDDSGYMQITDRAKDVIKSGGEWISSLQVEQLVREHPAVLEAAVIGVPHPRWDERPLVVVVRRPGHSVSAVELVEFLRGRVAKWWLPDAVELIDQMPYTATGKISKRALRNQFASFRFNDEIS